MRILFLTQRFPYPPDRGDRIRAYNVLRELAASGAEVSLGCVTQEPTTEAQLAEVDRLCERVAAAPTTKIVRAARCAASLLFGRSATEGNFWSGQLARRVQAWHRERPFDAVYCFCSGVYAYARLPALRDTPVVVDLVDVDSQKWADCAARSRGPAAALQSLEARRVARLERRLSSEAARVFLISDAEREVFRRVAPGAKVQVALNGVDSDYFAPAAEPVAPDEATCVFVGVLNYQPNVDAMRWFADNVLPLLRRRRPDARLRIVGRSPSATVRRLAERPGVELHADAPDVRPLLAGSAVTVAPLRIARGVQNKVLEAMSMGRPVVASPAALAGLSAEPGRDLIVADAAAEWAEQVARLMGDPSQRAVLGEAARSYVLRRHSWGQTLAPLVSALQEVAASGSSGCDDRQESAGFNERASAFGTTAESPT